MQPHLWRKNLRVLRKQSGKTQSGIALDIGTTQQVIGNWESKTNPMGTPDLAQLLTITNLFGVSFEDFMNRDFENAGDGAAKVAKDVGRKNYPENERLTIAGEPAVSYHTPNVLDVVHKTASEIWQILQQMDRRQFVADLYLPDLGPGRHIRLQMVGDGMHPQIKDKDIVIATRVAEGLPELREGPVYVAVDKEDGIICKRMYRVGEDELQMVSDNEDYRPYNRHVQQIEMLFKVQQVHSSNLHKYRTESSHEIEKLWKAIEELRLEKKRVK